GVNIVKQQGVELPPINFSIRKMVYPSGLTVLAERDDRTKLAGIFLVVGSGSTSDPAGKEGLAHYVEHLTFRSRPLDDRAFRQVLEESGGFFWNAFTSLDQTVY